MSEGVVDQRKPLRKRWWFWLVVAGIPAVFVALFVWLALWLVVSDEPLGADGEPTDCAGVLDTAGLTTLPVEQSEAECTEGGFQDAFETVDFTAPQADVDAWLADELPGFEPVTESCTDADACLEISWDEPNAPQDEGWHLDIELTEQGDGTTAVSVMVFTV